MNFLSKSQQNLVFVVFYYSSWPHVSASIFSPSSVQTWRWPKNRDRNMSSAWI